MFAEVERLTLPLDTHDADDGSGLKVLDRFIGYRVGDKEYWVECGFRTDFASFPSLARFIVRWNKTDDAAVIHDKPFTDGYIYEADGTMRKVSLWEMNRVFRKIMQYTANPQGGWFRRTWRSKDRGNPIQAWSSWTGLLLGSWYGWLASPRVDVDAFNENIRPTITNPLFCRES